MVEEQGLKERGASPEVTAKTEAVPARVRQLSEYNPMLGHRGCRLAVTYPEIYEMQAKAIVEAAMDVRETTGNPPVVKIMIPLVAVVEELSFLRGVVTRAAEEAFKEKGSDIGYQVGTTIETPRAALTAGEVAKHSDFFSFGTNDLTQTTFGFSRDDVESKFIPDYIEKGMLAWSPFDTVDGDGVGRLVKLAVEDGRRTKPSLEVASAESTGGPKEHSVLRLGGP